MKGEKDLKIHIVQKGDTLWKIAKAYDVDLDELKDMNHHIASPDMIMPGMKIKIPSKAEPTQHPHIKDPSTPETKEKLSKADSTPSQPNHNSNENDMDYTSIKEDEPLKSLQKIPELEADLMSEIDLNTSPFLAEEQPQHTLKNKDLTPSSSSSNHQQHEQQATTAYPKQTQHSTQIIPVYYPIYIPYPVTSSQGEQQLKRINEHNEREISKYRLAPTNVQYANSSKCTCQNVDETYSS